MQTQREDSLGYNDTGPPGHSHSLRGEPPNHGGRRAASLPGATPLKQQSEASNATTQEKKKNALHGQTYPIPPQANEAETSSRGQKLDAD